MKVVKVVKYCVSFLGVLHPVKTLLLNLHIIRMADQRDHEGTLISKQSNDFWYINRMLRRDSLHCIESGSSCGAFLTRLKKANVSVKFLSFCSIWISVLSIYAGI